MRAGVTNTGPRMDSRSSQPRTRSVTRGRPRGTGISSTLTAMSAREDLLHLGFGPGNGILRRGARHRLREHIGQQVRIGDELDLFGRRRRPPIDVVLHTLAPQRRVLRVRLQYGMILEVFVRGQVKGVAGHDVLVVDLALAEQIADPLLGGVDTLGELPDADVAGGGRLLTPPGPAQAPMMID